MRIPSPPAGSSGQTVPGPKPVAPGKRADMVVWNMPDYRHMGYHFGVNLVETTIVKGKVEYRSQQ